MEEAVFQKSNFDVASVNGKVVQIEDIHKKIKEIIPIPFINILANKVEKFEASRDVRIFK